MITKAIMAITLLIGGVAPNKPPTVERKCPHYWETALRVGWKWKDLPTLDKIMFRESNCIPSAFNGNDPNGGSRGLIQINGFWTPWLKQQGLKNAPNALFNPELNLLAGLHIYNYGVDRYGNGWGPWNL